MRVCEILRNVIFTVAVVIITGLGVLVLIFDIHPHIIVSGSMEPEIQTGSICFVNYKDRDVQKGDITAYRMGELTVLHRVIDEDSQGEYITKGDNNEVPDLAPVSKKQIIGTNVFHIPRLGYIVMAVKSHRWIVLTCLLLCYTMTAIVRKYIKNSTVY